MTSPIIIPADSDLYASLAAAAESQRMVFFAGIPGVGKSLYVQQLVLLAQAAGRIVHLFQYDVTRMAFEGHPQAQARYPEINGVTQPIMRKAVGLWARQGVAAWDQAYPDHSHMLIGELPLIGGRLIELVQPHNDPVEPLLAGNKTLLMIPVPSRRIREKIVARRADSIENPQHENETKDAPINVLQMVWRDAHELAVRLGLAEPLADEAAEVPYDPAVYAAVYEYLGRHRHVETLFVDLDLNPTASVYELSQIASQPQATAAEVETILDYLETHYSLAEIGEMVDQWFN